MGRPPLPVGTSGRISVRQLGPKRFRARCRFRDYDGQVRYVVRLGASRSGAESALKVALTERTSTGPQWALTRDSRVNELARLWLGEVDESDRAASTKRRYEDLANGLACDGLGQLRLVELTVPAVDRFLRVLRVNHGAATAKGVRSVLSGMVGLAMRHGAMTTNPVRDVSPISTPRKAVRALTPGETSTLLEKLAVSEPAMTLDLLDLCHFMLGTGCRLGEACGLQEAQVDLENGVVEINATAGDAGIEERTKSDAGWRVIAVPPSIVQTLRRRIQDPTIATHVAVFPSPLGRVRNKSNTTGDLRRVLDAAGFPWVTSHIFRKTVATRLDEAGQSARQIADHLGHAQPSMTQDVYLGRRTANAAAASILEHERGH